MIKVCFMYPSWDNRQTLEMYRKMTPNCSGVWDNIVGVTSKQDADYCVIIDYTHERIPEGKAIYVSAHPKMIGFNGYYDLSKYPLKLDAKDTFGFGEWWLKYDYDYLMDLTPPKKTKDLCCIMSDTDGAHGRTQRKKWLKEYAINNPVNIYGRIEGIGMGKLGSGEHYGGNHCHGKEEVLEEHKYSIEVDVGLTRNYFSERLFDSLLMWCFPFYYGSTNLEDFLPANCFRYIDIYSDVSQINEWIESDIREFYMDDIAEARDLLLNKYQIWARIHEFINNNPLLSR